MEYFRQRLAVTALVCNVLMPASAVAAGTTSLVRMGADGPLVNLAAMRHEGELAFVSRGDLYIIDGSAGALHEIPVGSGALAIHPVFSPDGEWLAYETEIGATLSSPQWWVVRSNGQDRHPIDGVDGFYGWDPTQDLLAVTTDTSYRQIVRGSRYVAAESTRLDLVSPTDGIRRIASLPVPTRTVSYPPPQIWDATWSPSGQAVAVAIDSFVGGSTIRSYSLDGGKPTTWFAINATAQLPGSCSGCGGGNTIAQLAGWWSDWGIGFWAFSSGAVHGLDSSPLELVHTPGSVPHIIGHTLSNGTTDELAASEDGSLAIVASARNAGRSYGIGKQVETCQLGTLSCALVPGASTWVGLDPVRCPLDCAFWPAPGKPGSAVSLDPAWSPDGQMLAYVKSPAADTGGWPPLSWFEAHRLFIFDTAAQRSTEVADVKGVSVPTWSHDDKDLLYVTNDDLWLSSLLGGKATQIAGPLFPLSEWHNIVTSSISFYGQIAWTAQFAWWSP